MPRIPRHQGVSPVVGVILMVAVTVILSATVATVVMERGNDMSANPQAGVTVDQNITGNGGDYSAVVQIHSMDNADYIYARSNVTADDGEIGLKHAHEHGIMYRWNDGTVEWSEFKNDGKQIYKMEVPSNSGSVDVTAHFEADSYESSGAVIYAKDASGDLVPITDSDGNQVWCDGEARDTTSPPTSYRAGDYHDHSTFSCSDQAVSGGFTWDNTYTATSSSEITGVYISTDMTNVDEEFWDRARLYQFEVSAGGETNTACVECFAEFSSTEDGTNYDGDNIHYGQNDAAGVGETIAVRRLQPDAEVTIVAVKDGKEPVLETYEIRDNN